MHRSTKRVIPNMTHRTLQGLFWTFSGTGAQACLRIVMLMIFARLLSPKDFGLIATALVIVGFLQVFSRLGVGPAIIQLPNLTDDHLRNGFTLSLILGSFFFVLIWVASPIFSSFFRMRELTEVLRFTGLTFLLAAPSIVAESIICRKLQFRLLSVIQVFSYALGFCLVGGLLAWFQFGVWALVVAHLVQTTLAAILIIIFQNHPKKPMLQQKKLAELLRFGIPLSIGKIANRIALEGDYFVVGHYLGATALGYYSRAYHLMAMPARVYGEAVDKVLFPAMSMIQNESKRLALSYRRGISITASMALPASAIMFVLAPEIVDVFLGSQWTEAIAPLRILALGIFFRVGYKMGTNVLRATGNANYLAMLQITYAIQILIGAWLGQHFGITGVSIFIVAGLISQFCLLSYISNKRLSMKWKEFLIALLPGVTFMLLLGSLALVVSTIARTLELTNLLTLTLCLSSIILTIVFILLSVPGRLGEDLVWWLRTVQQYIPSKLRPYKPSRT